MMLRRLLIFAALLAACSGEATHASTSTAPATAATPDTTIEVRPECEAIGLELLANDQVFLDAVGHFTLEEFEAAARAEGADAIRLAIALDQHTATFEEIEERATGLGCSKTEIDSVLCGADPGLIPRGPASEMIVASTCPEGPNLVPDLPRVMS